MTLDKDKEIVKLMFTLKIPIDDVQIFDDHASILTGNLVVGSVPIIAHPFGEIKYESAETVKEGIDWPLIYYIYEADIASKIAFDLKSDDLQIKPTSLWFLAVKNFEDGKTYTYECVYNYDYWHVIRQ